MKNSPISKIILEGREFLIKRDDLFDPYLAGNKYRKLHTLLQTPKQNLNKIISYGGSQSNAMLAISAMCREKGWEFIYYTKPLNQTMKEQKSGNFFRALELGMHHKELENELYREFISSLDFMIEEGSFVVHQGGADRSAKEGLKVLSEEIREQKEEQDLDFRSIATPSGTGTTALFLALNLPEYKIYTTPCIGDAEYLREQMSALHKIPSNLVILESPKKYHFAKPYKEFFEIYKKTKDAGVVFDLLYAPAMWLTLLEQIDDEILYIHSGGVSGNESMLQRYVKKGYSLGFK